MIRRLVALLLAFAMLHLSVARADAACAMHDAASPAGHEGMQHGGGAPAEQTRAEQSRSDQMPCEAPVSPDCCQALASCAPVLSIAEELAPVSSPAIVPMTIVAAVIERPLSRSTAPEPPPPKA